MVFSVFSFLFFFSFSGFPWQIGKGLGYMYHGVFSLNQVTIA